MRTALQPPKRIVISTALADAPLADRVDLEQLQVGEVDAVAEADQGDAEAGHPSRVAAQQRRGQQQHVADDAEDRDVDAEQVRVGAVGDRLAAVLRRHTGAPPPESAIAM